MAFIRSSTSRRRWKRFRIWQRIRASGLFDEPWYLAQNLDVAASGTDPILHYIDHGAAEHRNPNRDFDTEFYLARYPDVALAAINPLDHFILVGKNENRDTRRVPATNMPRSSEGRPAALRARLIAFYLPQFHPIPENDAFWGKGFTEWADVTRATPQFDGHYQPRLPADLGFYDLRVKDIQKQQIAIAMQYGISAFCFHFYWFNGRRPLEMPITQFVENDAHELGFCINWVNEHWSRRWDGRRQEMLILQSHSPEDDLAFIEYVAGYFRDRRYIRVGGKPFLMIYRPGLFPSARETAQRWRAYCREAGIGEIFLACPQSSDMGDPAEFGFDAAVEFPPDLGTSPEINASIPTLKGSFTGKVYDWTELAGRSRAYPEVPYTLFRGLCPSWDNTARRAEAASVLVNASPARYGEWLANAIVDTCDRFADFDSRLIFVNAWNEWAEGAYLEPDARYGFAYLQETRDALSAPAAGKLPRDPSWRVLFVSHDAAVGGAQSSLIDMMQWFQVHTNLEIKVLCLGGGQRLEQFRRIADTVLLDELISKDETTAAKLTRITDWCGGRPDLIYCNSLATGRVHALLGELGVPILTHARELATSVARHAKDDMKDVVSNTQRYVACSRSVRDYLVAEFSIQKNAIDVIPSAVPQPGADRIRTEIQRAESRRVAGWPMDKTIVVGAGVGVPFRKGADLFIEVARILRSRGAEDFHFYWLGAFPLRERDVTLGTWSQQLDAMRADGLDETITFLGNVDDVRRHLRGADLFLLTSREEPFGRVILEAAHAELPVICFAESGGAPDFVEDDAGIIVGWADPVAMADATLNLIRDKSLRMQLGRQASAKARLHFSTDRVFPRLLSAMRKVADKPPAVSIIVPNYNYARYLRERMDSILGQSFQDFELIILDDASTDGSQSILNYYAGVHGTRVIVNDRNSGAPYPQWFKGMALARADLIWIAEADDVSDPSFLETLVPLFRDPGVKFAFCASKIINDRSETVGDYLSSPYLTDLSNFKWRRSYQVSAAQEVNEGLGVKNTVINISAAVFRKFDITPDFVGHVLSLPTSGDWYFILEAIRNGSVAYEAALLNHHRRHDDSVTSIITASHSEALLRTRQMIHQHVLRTYPTDLAIKPKMAEHVLQLWNQLFPGRPAGEMESLYSLTKLGEFPARSPRIPEIALEP
ncbi:glycoside hydrolase family 99-like domain-containing protein [Mesorhizobium sp. NZP2298]|uniref:glycoside hydrolase family 99-like domain-containing protein n=1 Tax=Mesorhizobium sp. NZP2298 TaxID=2483403 RepID=UPI001556513A|nr:glycoside hydrolase family 99-like domain-containing protein [Mesorhizobium sp. NZP2298]QKC93902.1 glycosyltransferase [Mesorhizobium sp. NZP2298]